MPAKSSEYSWIRESKNWFLSFKRVAETCEWSDDQQTNEEKTSEEVMYSTEARLTLWHDLQLQPSVGCEMSLWPFTSVANL